MMSFRLGELAEALHESERFAKIAESERALDASGIIAQLPTRRLPLQAQRLIGAKRRNAAATGGARLVREGVGHDAVSGRAYTAMLSAGSAIDLAEHDVERADDRRDVRQHVPASQEIHRLQVGERRRPDLAFVGAIGAVRHQIDPELPLRRLDRGVDLAGRHAMALAVELEMVDGRLHRALHLGARRRNDLVVLDGDRSRAFPRLQSAQALLHDAHRLAHLLHSHDIAIVVVAVLADRNVEIELGIALVGLRLAQVPGCARTAHHDPGKSPPPGIFERDRADADVALLEDAVFRQQPFDIVADLEERIAKRGDVVEQLRRQILVHASDAEIIRVHASSRGALIKHHELLALFESPERRRERADVHRLRGHIRQMRKQPPDLAIEHADELGALGHGETEQLLGREAEGVLLVHRRDVIESVEIRNRLQVGLVLDQLLGPSVQQADMRIDALDHFAVELQYETQHAVRGRVLRPEIDGEVTRRSLAHGGLALTAGSTRPCDRGFLLCRARIIARIGRNSALCPQRHRRNRVAAPAFSRRHKDDHAEDDSSHPSSRRGSSRFQSNTPAPPLKLRGCMDHDTAPAKPRISAGRISAFACVVVLAAAAGVLGAQLIPPNWHPAAQSVPLRSAALLFGRSSSGPAGFADIVDMVKPAVVGVQTKRSDTSEEQGSHNAPGNRFFRRFGAPPLTPQTPGGRHPPRMVTTQGSGFFISADGYAVTNNHVIEGSKTAEIQTDDQKTYTAKVVGSDPISDLALLKIDGRNDFTFVKLADDMPRAGDWVLAIGNPFGLGGTVTAGIVSARERNIGAVTSDSLLQIDAPINKGDSGGPTFDLNGKVIGVNMMIFSPSGGSIGIAFAIPAATVRTVIAQLKDKGSVSRGWLGVQIQPVTAEIADVLGLKLAEGALIAEPVAEGPAARAGLISDDVIASVDDKPIKDAAALSKVISGTAPGTSVKLGIVREGKERNIDVALGELPVPAQNPAASLQHHGSDEPETMGRGDAAHLGLKLAPAGSIAGAGEEGVVVTDIEAGGLWVERGFELGDVILEVGGKSVKTPTEIESALGEARNAGKQIVLLRLKSGEAMRFVTVPVG